MEHREENWNLPADSIPPAMSATEYEVWQKFIQDRCGLYFTQTRQRYLRQRLWERMRLCAIKSYSEYYRYVVYNSRGGDEWAEILTLLLNNETSFFRHVPSFDALARYVLPELTKEKSRHGVTSMTMWSAGCAAGQEAYSLAMTFLEFLSSTPPIDEKGMSRTSWQLMVTGTDIDLPALDKARRAQYKASEVRYMPEAQRNRYVRVVSEDKGVPSNYKVVDTVRAVTQFGHLNLIDPAYWVSAQDVIFCQNVLLYFELESRLAVVQRLCQCLNPGGFLFLAPAEVVGLKLPGIQLVRQPDSLIYQRTSYRP
ncbi:MAG: protein-glutamate O-methyltransferase CheR [Chloroflexi bacterium]|nr:protein-glutamate O-methyltransferase CheR [Chloroflexota bacterium]